MNIIVYTKTGCGWAQEVMDWLTEHKIPFMERDMLKNPAYREEAIDKSGQWKSPTLDIDGHILPDSDAAQVESYLKLLSRKNMRASDEKGPTTCTMCGHEHNEDGTCDCGCGK